MTQLKVRARENIVMNMIVHLILSFSFLYLQYAYRNHLSPFSLVYLRKSMELFWYVATFMVLSSIFIWKCHKFSLWMYNICILIVGFKVVEGLFIEFNKVIVVALFFYTTVSYFLYQIFSQYLEQSALNLNYRPTDLFGPILKKIPCSVKTSDKENLGYLTNWDEDGCFVRLQDKTNLPKNVVVKIKFYDRDFEQNGEVVAETQDLEGVGIKFKKVPKDLNMFNWSEFIELVRELGFVPERLR